MLEPMAKVEIIGHRRRLTDTLAAIQQMGVLHLLPATDVPGAPGASMASEEAEVRESARLRQLRTRLDSVLGLIGTPREESPAPSDTWGIDDAAAELERITPEIERLVTAIDESSSEAGMLPHHIASLHRLLPLVPSIPELADYETIALLIDRRYAEAVDMLRSELEAEVGPDVEVISGTVDSATIGAIVVYPADASRRVHTLLSREQVSRIELPDEFRGMPLAETVAAMERRLTALPEEIASTREELAALLGPATRWLPARGEVDRRLERMDALRAVGVTEHTFTMAGWVPAREVSHLAAFLEEHVGAEIVLVPLDPAENDRPPVLMSNPRPARPFESLVGLLALPRYGTLDPTMLMALFLPLFFGIMLGDIGYGILLLGITVWMGRRWAASPMVVDLARVLRIGAIWAVVWGVLFGELFGDLGRRLFDLPAIWIYREEAIEPLLLFAVAIGAAHIVLGLALGIFVSARTGARKALGERIAMLTALSGLFVIAGTAADRLPSGLMTPAVVAIVIALAVLVASDWPLGLVTGPLDLVGIVSNVLSYLRIAAIGLASVFLARVANELGTTGPLWLGIAIASLFHALNLALGAFSPTIQALRLHYVEFFDKFFEPGGEQFVAFGTTTTDTGAPAPRPRPAPIGTP